MRLTMLVPIIILTACQTAPKPAAPASQSWEEFKRDRPDTFIASYNQVLEADKQRLIQLGLEKDLKAIRAAVDFHLPPGNYTLQATGANAAILRRLRVENVTNNLVTYGYRVAHFGDTAEAKRLVRAAAGVFGGPSSDVDLAIFAPTVLVADLERVEDAADGSGTLIYRVIEPLKNAPAKGAEFRLALRGPRPPSPYPPPPQPGEGELQLPGRVVLFLSPPRYAGTGSGPRQRYARITQPMRVDGEKLTPGYHSDIPETTLTKLKAAIREQVCAPGFVPVGAVGGISQSC